MLKHFCAVLAAVFCIAASVAQAQNLRYETWWGNIFSLHPDQKSVDKWCKLADIGGPSWYAFRGQAYIGKTPLNPEQDVFRCEDTKGHTADVNKICKVYDGTTFLRETLGDCPEECNVCNQPPGALADSVNTDAPVEIPSFAKVENVADWVSPRDSRFRLTRLYRSDDLLAEVFEVPDVRDGLAGIWRFGYDEFLREGRSGEALGKLSYFVPNGGVYIFDQATLAPNRSGHAFSLAYAGSDIVLSDGSGLQKTFVQGADSYFMLTEMAWGDGYSIAFERGTDGRLLAFEDNKNQRVEVTWSTSVVPNFSNPLISEFQIDPEYDGSTFSPEIAIEFTYQQNTIVADNPMLKTSEIVDLATSQSEIQHNHSFLFGNITYPPKMTAAFDGRLDQGSNPIQYKTVTYHGSTSTWLDRVSSSELAGGANRSEFSELPDGRISILNALGRETLYTYTGQGADRRLENVEGVPTPHCLGTNETYDHSTNTLLGEKIERNGSKTTFVRDADGNITTKTEDADGLNPKVTTYTWHATFRKPLTRETTHLRETFGYDTDGLLTSYAQTDILTGSPTNGQTRTWAYTYTTLASGLKVLTSVDGPGDPLNVTDVTSYTYNTDGTLASMTDPNGLITTYDSYSSLGQVTQTTLPDGVEWGFTYDIEGRMLTSARDPNGASPETTSFVYDEAGLLTEYTNADSQTWSFEYDGARRLIKATNPSGEYASYEYDAMGNVTAQSQHQAGGAQTFLQTSEFDELGRILRVNGASAHQFAYDEEDNLVSTEDAFGLARTQTYDALNRVLSVVDEHGYTTLFEHDENDQVTEYTDPRSIDTDFVYNGFGELMSETSADRGTMSYTYNARGLITSMIDGRGVLTNYSYDDGGRLISKTIPSDSTLDQSFTYGANGTASAGKLITVTDQSGSTNYAHATSDGLPQSETASVALESYTTAFGFDAVDRMDSVTYPSGNAVLYSYDTDGQISGVTFDPIGQSAMQVASSIQYQPNGPLSQLVYGDSATLTQGFDDSYQLTSQTDDISGVSLRELALDWSGRGNLATVEDILNGNNDRRYGYSSAGRLATASGEWDGLAYFYDAVGNRSSLSMGTVNPEPSTAPGAPAPNGGDPYWDNVTYIAGYEDDLADESAAGLGEPNYKTLADVFAVKPEAAQIGSAGLSVNRDNQYEGFGTYGVQSGIHFGTGDFTIEGFAQSTHNDNNTAHSMLGNWHWSHNNSWHVFLSQDWGNKVGFGVDGYPTVAGTTDLGTQKYHFAVTRTGDVLRIFVNGVMEAKATGWDNIVVGTNSRSFVVGGGDASIHERWRGYLDELRITKGVSRYYDDLGFAVPTTAYPRDTSDPHWSSVTYLAGFENGLADEGPLSLGTPSHPNLQDPFDKRASAAIRGTSGLAVNVDGQSDGYGSYGSYAGIDFGLGDFTIEGFAKSTSNNGSYNHAIIGNYHYHYPGTWAIWLLKDSVNRVEFGSSGKWITGSTDLNNNSFHYAISRNGDVMRLFVNGVMEAKQTGWANVHVGNSQREFRIGGVGYSANWLQYKYRWRGYIDETRITKGVGRYNSDANITVPASAYPRSGSFAPKEGEGLLQILSQHVPSASGLGVTTETQSMPLGDPFTDRHMLVNVAWRGPNAAEITSVTIGGVAATRLHRLTSGTATENAELWAVPMSTGTEADVEVTWDTAISHRHVTLYAAPLTSLTPHAVATGTSGGVGYQASGVTLPRGAMLIGGTLGDAYDDTEAGKYAPAALNWDAANQRSARNGVELQSHVFSMETPLEQAATIALEGPSPFYAVILGGQDFLDPGTVTTDTYTYGPTDNRLASIAEAGGHTRTFTYDASGNTTYDNRSGGGYGYTYDALGRMASFSINGVLQAEYAYNAQGQQVVRRLTQSGQTIHNVFDLDGNRIAEYLYDEVGGTSTLIREYIWLNGQVIGVWEGGQLFYVRTDHIGRPVFATNDLGLKVWEASYLPFGGVHASSGPNSDLRFPGQWFQSESGLHQNWMRDYDPTTGRYLQSDPLGLVDGASVYGYALQNPGRYVDPRGEASIPRPGPVLPFSPGGDGGMPMPDDYNDAWNDLLNWSHKYNPFDLFLQWCFDPGDSNGGGTKCTYTGERFGVDEGRLILVCYYSCEDGKNIAIEESPTEGCPKPTIIIE